MIEDWIDHLCAVWAISDQRFGTVKSYSMIGETDFPSSIDPLDLDIRPIALSIPSSMQPEYSVGGVREGHWQGVTQFHVCSDLSMARMPELLPWYGRIVTAAAASMKLHNSVIHFAIAGREDAITGPIALQYGNEAAHWGFIVHWIVKENISVTVSA